MMTDWQFHFLVTYISLYMYGWFASLGEDFSSYSKGEKRTASIAIIGINLGFSYFVATMFEHLH